MSIKFSLEIAIRIFNTFHSMKTDTSSPNTIEAYIIEFPQEIQEILQCMRSMVKIYSEDITECMSYGIPTFKLAGKNCIHFAAYKSHIGIYPGPAVIVHFKEQLTSYETSKGTIKFSLKEPIPYSLVEEIIRFSVTKRVLQ